MESAHRGLSREEQVKKSAQESDETRDFKTFIPNGNAVGKIQGWKRQGVEIYYLTSRTTKEQVDDIHYVLTANNFPDPQHLLFRKNNQTYKDVAEVLMPNVLIEDDCESIGGEVEMTYLHIKEELKSKIHSIVVKEFAGIDDLPDRVNDLL